MSRVTLPNVMVGNEFIMPAPKLRMASPAVHGPLPSPTPPVLNDVVFVFEKGPRGRGRLLQRLLSLVHDHSLAVFALLFLAVGGSALVVGSRYWSTHITLSATRNVSLHIPARPLRGPNLTIASSDLDKTLRQITSQAFNLKIDGHSVAVSRNTVQGWLQIVTDKTRGVSYIHVDQSSIAKSLQEVARPFVAAPVNQVTVTRAGGSSLIISAGKNGRRLGNTQAAAKQIEQDLLSAKGLRLDLPVSKQAYSSVTADSFDKLIEVDVVTKQMYLYDKGKLTRSYLISAGAPLTPTPIGQFKIYQKLPVQDMRGFNTDGTRYYQPHVYWVNYFLPGGYAVHGVYWHGSSWFGNINSSHGCVGLPDEQAKWVYDWAPLGTTVITHY